MQMRRRTNDVDDSGSEQMSAALLASACESNHEGAADSATRGASNGPQDGPTTRHSTASTTSAFSPLPSSPSLSYGSTRQLFTTSAPKSAGAWHVVEELSSPLATRLPLRTGVQHVVHTADGVGAVTWGISPCALLPCCLGERKKGVKVMHVGFQYGRHVELYEHEPPEGERGHFFSFLFPLPSRYVAPGASRSPAAADHASVSFDAPTAKFRDGEVGAAVGDGEANANANAALAAIAAERERDRREFRERLATHPRGCLEMTPDGKGLTTGDFDPDNVRRHQIFRVAPLTDFSGTFTGARWRSGDEPPEVNHCRYVIAPLVDLTLRLQWRLNGGVIARPPLDTQKSAQQVFLIRPRAPHLITDFVVEGVPFCTRLKSSFSRAEDDYRRCLVMQHDNTVEGSPLLKDERGEPVPRHPTVEAPVLHDFLSTQLGRTAGVFLSFLGVFNATTTIVITIGVGYDGEEAAAMGIRYALYTLIVLTYMTLWIQHNMYYSARMFDFLIRRGFLFVLSPDVVSPKYLFGGGWMWYWFAVAVFLGLGGVYQVYFRGAPLGTCWLFFSNALLYFVGQVYKLRAPFDQQLMPLSVFVKSFDNGLISDVAIRRAAEFLRGLRPVQGCVPLANPPAYAYLGQLPTSVRCCWGCGKFSARATVLIVLSIFIGAAMLAAVVVRATLTKVDAFAAVNTCVANCVDIATRYHHGASTAPPGGGGDDLCGECICLCARTLKIVSGGFQTTCQVLLDVPSCAAADCPASCVQ